ncbi:hypothetical protein M0R45_030652 [Rubus argutus]|uniref:hAT-like transposase RNase-H fold domain-containing protein n=1 Tax=Rubus argutus TaxID=59490 RepID=A0AAW1WFR5_RUBAR
MISFKPKEVVNACVEMIVLFVEPEMATGGEVEKVLTEMAANMNAKFLKYYGSFKDLNPLVFMRLVLDPRFKLRHIAHPLRKENYNEEDVQN